MKKETWLYRNRWWLAGLILSCLALATILTIWGVQAHQYQLDLAHYLATNHKTITVTIPGDDGRDKTFVLDNPDYHPPIDTTGPQFWGWAGWAIRILAIFVPALLGFFLYWREHYQYVRVHKTHLDHATNKLAEAIGENQQLPEGVFDAYSRLRELEKRHPPV